MIRLALLATVFCLAGTGRCMGFPVKGELARGKEIRVVAGVENQLVIEPLAGAKKPAVLKAVPFTHAKGDNLPKPEQSKRPDPEFFRPLVAVVCDADGDGQEEVYVGWGGSDYSMKAATPQVVRYTGDELGQWKAELVWQSPATVRPDVTSMTSGDLDGDKKPEVVFSVYRSKYVSGGHYLTYKGGTRRVVELHDSHMGLRRVVADLDGDGVGEVYVGKVYAVPLKNPDQDWPADVFLYQDPLSGGGPGKFLEADKAAKRLPTVNGIRGAFAKADIDKDGRDELYVADGWHAEYARKARAQLTQVRMDKTGKFVATLIEEVGEASIPNVQEIYFEDLDRDGRLEIIAAVPWSQEKVPSLRYHAYKLGKDGWVASALPPDADLSATDWKKIAWTEPRKAGGATPPKPGNK